MRGLDWPAMGARLRKESGAPNSRFTAPVSNNPVLDPAWTIPGRAGLSNDFGGRRGTTIPLVYESLDWNHGVYLGATLGSETTAAATGQVGVVRRDPMGCFLLLA